MPIALIARPSVGCPGTSGAPSGRVITLTSVGLSDLSAVHTWPDFAAYLKGVHQRSGMSLGDLEKVGKRLTKADGRFRELPTSTVSDALSGKRPVKKNLLESLLTAWRMPAAGYVEVVGAWQRINAAVGQGPANARRVDEASPRELGVHPAISVDGATDDLPTYVPRDFDDKLRDLIARGVERGCFVLLIGGSSWGKTRSLYEAVRVVVPDWWLVQPAKTYEIHDLLAAPTDRTVLWLDDLHRYLGADPPLLREHVVTLVRTTGIIVVGTLWPDYYFMCKRLPADGADVHAEDRLLLDFADVIRVPDAFTEDERQRASDVATVDRRIKTALAVSDAGVTQVLAAGPDLVISWEQAPDPYSRAIISAAADARRLGVQSPLPAEVLTKAIVDYLTPAQRAAPVAVWLDRALRHATNQLHGAVSALIPVAREHAGTVDGYVVADYLTQHIGMVRRVECPPDSLWTVLVTHVSDLDDLRRLTSTALARMRYRYAEQALRRLQRTGDRAAAVQLIALLRVRTGPERQSRWRTPGWQPIRATSSGGSCAPTSSSYTCAPSSSGNGWRTIPARRSCWRNCWRTAGRPTRCGCAPPPATRSRSRTWPTCWPIGAAWTSCATWRTAATSSPPSASPTCWPASAWRRNSSGVPGTATRPPRFTWTGCASGTLARGRTALIWPGCGPPLTAATRTPQPS